MACRRSPHAPGGGRLKRLLFLVYELGNLGFAWMLAEHGRASGAFDVILWSPYGFAETERIRAEASGKGTLYLHEANSDGSLADYLTPMSAHLSGKPARLPLCGATWPPLGADAFLAGLDAGIRQELLRSADRCLRRAAFCEDILVRLGVDALVMSEDNTERDSFGWIEAARRRGIPATVVSYAALSPEEARNAYARNAAHQVGSAWRPFFERHLPHWLRSVEGGLISRLPPIEAAGRVLAGFDRWNPWLVNSAEHIVVGLESARMLDFYVENGFKPDRLVETGHPVLDRLHTLRHDRAAGRQKLQALGIVADRPLILIGMPPDHTATRPIEFGSYSSVQDAFTHAPRNLADTQILVSPHPNATAEQKAFLTARGVPLLDVSAAELLPLADLYIASVSSTIKWALACGLPVIDYDIYGYRYGDFLASPQVATAYTHEAFLAALDRWHDPKQRRDWEAVARANCRYWGRIDGAAMRRVAELMLSDR